VLTRNYKHKLIDLYYITGYKEFKACEFGLKLESQELSKTKSYIETAISEELNLKWVK